MFSYLGCLAAAAALLASTSAFDCSVGCSTDGTPVCGADGVLYANECIAACQGVAIASSGVCTGSLPPATTPAIVVTMAQMSALKAEGFNFQRYQKVSSAPAIDEAAATPMESLHISSNLDAAPAGLLGYAVRMLVSGLVYAQPLTASRRLFADSDGVDFPATRPLGQRPGNLHGEQEERDGRELIIFDMDNRVQVPDTTAYPFSAIGRLFFYSPVDDSFFVCSASVIARDAILTAGHCAATDGVFHAGFSFSPGRAGLLVVPFGRWTTFTTVTTFSKWLDSRSSSFKLQDLNSDMAVITFDIGGDTLAHLGDVVGTFGVSAACPVYNVTTTGYPADLDPDGGATMFTQKCDMTKYIQKCGNNIVVTDCDLYGGQSGSAVYDPEYEVHAVVSFNFWKRHLVPEDAKLPGSLFPQKAYNGLVAITKRKLKSIVEWAGL